MDNNKDLEGMPGEQLERELLSAKRVLEDVQEERRLTLGQTRAHESSARRISLSASFVIGTSSACGSASRL